MVIDMATAFTKQEETIILEKLKNAAKEIDVSLGVRRTTVDQLVAAAGISKGAFYKFYASKELLFSIFWRKCTPRFMKPRQARSSRMPRFHPQTWRPSRCLPPVTPWSAQVDGLCVAGRLLSPA